MITRAHATQASAARAASSGSPLGERRPAAAALVLCVLVALLAPASIPVFAGFTHTAYHILTAPRHDQFLTLGPQLHGVADHAAEEHGHSQVSAAEADHHAESLHDHTGDTDVVEHSHGPGEEPHSHSVVVDGAIALAGDGAGTQMGPAGPQQVDRYVPPTARDLAPAPAVAAFDVDLLVSPHIRLTSAPPVPPPRS